MSGSSLKILQWNANGIGNKKMELKELLVRLGIHVALLQETKLGPASRDPVFPGYTTIRVDRPSGGGGGLLALIRKDVPFTHTTAATRAFLPVDDVMEIQTLNLRIGGSDYGLANLYLPPSSSCPGGYTPDFSRLPGAFGAIQKYLVLGDFNAHHPSWYFSQAGDSRGDQLLDQLEGLVVLNCPFSPTRLPFSADYHPTSPDVSLASPRMGLGAQWAVHHDLSSDHLPIVVEVPTSTPIRPRRRKAFTNFKKAQWREYTAMVEGELADLDPMAFPSTDAAAKRFTTAVLAASNRFVPAGRIRKFVPLFSREVRLLLRERKHLRRQPQTPETMARLGDLSGEIGRRFREDAQLRWAETLASVDHRTSPSKFWKLVRSLHSRFVGDPDTHEAILPTPSSPIPSPKGQANLLVNHFAGISRLPHRPSDRLTQRRLDSLPRDSAPEAEFSTSQVWDAIRGSGHSTATGPDGVAYAHLKNLGPCGVRFLTGLFNRSLRFNSIPSLWKQASIIPLLKPGKPPNHAGSYRPISLLCTASKILERLVLNKITPLLPLSPTQHGFRALHSTTSLLTCLSQSILEGLNHGKPALRSLVAAIDLSKAFDTVPRYSLVSKLLDTDLPPYCKRWLANFVAGRQSHVSYNGTKSKTRMFQNGVPQGAVLSPSLFNFFLHDLPTPHSPHVNIYSYADDLTVLVRHPLVGEAENGLQVYLCQLEEWLTSNRMVASPQKSSVTLITPFNREYRVEPRVTLLGVTLPVLPYTKILGVTYDRGMTFRQHALEVNARARSRLNTLKALSSTEFGHSKESQVALYRQFVRPVLEYACPAWTPDLAQTHLEMLQRTQNAALRIATGCVRSTPTAHLHAETKVLPLKPHVDMRGVQCFAAASRQDHPLHTLHLAVGTRRQIHTTPSAHFRALRAQIPPLPPQRKESSWIHEFFVSKALSDAAPNSSLGEVPPPIASDELSLPRRCRVDLARLRCGHHLSLRSYENRLRTEVDPNCRWCGSSPETVSHIFQECPTLAGARADRGITGPRALWSNPALSLDFLRSIGLLQNPQ